MDKIIKDLRSYALENYAKDGWDILVECYDDEDIMQDMDGGSFYLGIVELFGDMPCDMQTMFALFLIGASGLGVLYFIILMMKRITNAN